MKDAKYILAFDPSLNGCGYCVLNIQYKNPKIEVVGTIQVKTSDTIQQKLGIISAKTKELLSRYQPLYRTIFFEKSFTRHNTSTQQIFRAKGSIESELHSYDIEEIAIATIKKIIGKHGQAEKEKVMKEVCKILKIKEDVFTLPNGKIDDNMSDATAVALVGYYEYYQKQL